MKKIIESKGIAVLAFLIFILIFSGCADFFTPPKPGGAAAGTGTFTLQIEGAGSQNRVIMPVTDTLVFAGYTLVFTDTTSILPPQTFYLSETDKGNPIALEAGTYDLNVTAYTAYTSSSINTPAAKGELKNIVIPAGGGVGGTVTLNAIFNEGGNGTFSWDINFSSQISEAWMEISSQTDSSFSPITSYFISADAMKTLISNPDDMTLPSGHYRVIFTLEEDSSRRQVIWRETLHVYENLTSHFEHDFSDYIFIKESYSLTLKNLYSPAGNPRPDEISTYFYDVPVNVLDPARPSWKFDGWYTDEYFTSGNEWTDNYQGLNGDLILYAKWLDIPVLAFNPASVNFIMAKDSAVLPSPVTVTLENTGSAAAAITSIALSGSDAAYFQLSGHSSITSIAAGSNDTFDIEVITPPPAVVASYSALVTVTYNGNDGSKTVSAAVIFTVTDFTGTMSASQMITDGRNLVQFSGEGDQYGRYMLEIQGEWLSGEMINYVPVTITIDYNATIKANNTFDGVKDLGTVGTFTLQRTGSGNPQQTYFSVDLYMQHNAIKTKMTAVGGSLYLDNNGTQGAQVSTLEITSYQGYFWISNSTSDLQVVFEIESDAEWIYNSISTNPYPIFKQNNVTIYYWREDGSSGEGPGKWIWGDTYFTKYDPKLSGADTIIFNTHNIYAPGVFFVPGLGGTDFKPGNIDYAIPPALSNEVFELRIGSTVIGEAVVTATLLNGYNTSNGDIASLDISVTYNLNPAFLPLVQNYTCNVTSDTKDYNTNGSHTFTFNAKPYGPFIVNTVFTF